MNIRDRIGQLEAVLGGACVDEGEPCDRCGAPATTRRESLVVEIDEPERCDGCGRSVREGVPYIADHVVRINRPPTATERR